MADPWNHNIHYHGLILRAIPPGARRALDVGCGEGTLARQLRALVPHVTAIDADPASIALAREQAGPGIEYLLGDFLPFPFQPASFDFIASVATLHHMDAVVALTRMRDLLRPGGTLAIVGLPRPSLPADLPWLLASAAGSVPYRLTRTYWEHPSPTVWPPPETYADVRRIAARVLPGARVRRHLLWRYSLVWTKA
ncbi:MAG TPA: class I SAM-dependent methyltransferase [Longimicrobium sp.]